MSSPREPAPRSLCPDPRALLQDRQRSGAEAHFLTAHLTPFPPHPQSSRWLYFSLVFNKFPHCCDTWQALPMLVEDPRHEQFIVDGNKSLSVSDWQFLLMLNCRVKKKKKKDKTPSPMVLWKEIRKYLICAFTVLNKTSSFSFHIF